MVPHLLSPLIVLEKRMPKPRSTYSVLKPGCPSRLLLDRIADKWTVLVIQILAHETMRYSALQRQIGDISQKMLTQTLRSLERDGLVRRKIYPVASPRVEYTLTSLGRTLIEPLQGLCRWSEKHLSKLEALRTSAATKTPPANVQNTIS
jgi:DNA-binding HxlR family transcriptional regulator